MPVMSILEKGNTDDINFHNCIYLEGAKNYYYK